MIPAPTIAIHALIGLFRRDRRSRLTAHVFAGVSGFFVSCVAARFTTIRAVTYAIRSVNTTAILTIDSVNEDHYVPGAVITGQAFAYDIKSGERTPLYTRTDRVSVHMSHKDPKQ